MNPTVAAIESPWVPDHQSIAYLSVDSCDGEMNDMVIHRMVMAPILVVAALKYCISSIILPSEAS